MKLSERTALVVDDNDDFRLLIAAVLKREGFKVILAENGLEAKNWLESKTALPDLIVSDLKMPVLNGWDLAEFLYQDPDLRQIPLVIISSESPLPRADPDLHAHAILSKSDFVGGLSQIVKGIP